MISYAQNGEDVLLERLFRDVPAGVYIDVGANDPTDLSVTKHFYDRGWRGINIEPVPQAYARLCAERPRDRNLNLGLGDAAGTLTFYELPQQSVLSTFSAEQAALYRAAGKEVVERLVGMSTLARVCADHIDGPVHFLSIDVEGYEREVLRGADWTRWRPAVVLVEATRPNTTTPTHEAWEGLLLEAGYLFAYFDGLNRFYVRAENPELLEGFRVPVNICDGHVWYPHQRQLDELHRLLAESQARLQQSEGRLAERLGCLEATQAQLIATQAELNDARRRQVQWLTQFVADTQAQLHLSSARLAAMEEHLRALHELQALGPTALGVARLFRNSAASFPRLARAVKAALRKTTGLVRRPRRAA